MRRGSDWLLIVIAALLAVGLIAYARGTAASSHVIVGEQYVADVLPARMYRDEFARRGAGAGGADPRGGGLERPA